MLKAKVVGTATATVKHPSLEKQRMLLVQPYGPDGVTRDGDPLLAVDTFGAGGGDEVIITSDGPTARKVVDSDTTPVRWTVIGTCDR